MGRAGLKTFVLVVIATIQVEFSRGNTETAETVQGCNVKGRVYDLGHPFSFTNGCFRYTCDCKQDGSWDCPLDRTRNTCKRQPPAPTNKPIVRTGCRVRGRQYSLGRPFSFIDGCYKYRCRCNRDALWDCPASRTRNICHQTTTAKQDSHPTVTASPVEGCLVKGELHDLGQPFTFKEGCFVFNCQCFVDASWNCPKSKTEYKCDVETKTQRKHSTSHLSISGCTVKGKHYTQGRPFSFIDGCFQYHCNCKEEGIWECPATQTENICLRRREHKEGQQKAETFVCQTRIITDSSKVTSCKANGNDYSLGQPFMFDKDCFRYNCECKSDGSWECPADQALYTCRGEHSDQQEQAITRSVVVTMDVKACLAKGRQYTLDRPFSFIDGCFRYNCQCKSDGSWECLQDQAEYICQGSATGQHEQQLFYSRSVIISGGTKVKFCVAQGVRHPLGQPFSFSYGCSRFNCDCLINGSWICPVDRSEYICSMKHGDRREKISSWSMYIMVNHNVRSCLVNGVEFPLGRTFSFMEECFQFSCNCHRDGSWECPAKRTKYLCGQTEEDSLSQQTSHRKYYSRSVVYSVGTEVNFCSAHGKEYVLGHPFTFTQGCFQYNCQCYYNGSWECPAERSEYICPQQPGQQVEQASSRSMYIVIGNSVKACVARGLEYALGQPFSFMLDCYKYNCECHPNGSWECAAEAAEYICDPGSHHRKQETRHREAYSRSVVYSLGTVIRHCTVSGRQYRLGTTFSFEEGCFRYRCQCYRNGSWECSGDQSEYICPTQAGQKVTKASSRSVYVVVGNNLRVCTARGKQYPLGRPFSFTYECFRYNCDCDQSGSWECSADKTKYICDDSSGQEHSKEGQEHSKEGQEHSKEGDKHSREQTTQEAYSRSVVYSVGTVIQSCIVSGRQYRLGNPFSFEEGCFRYRCQCYRNGSWECSGDQSEYICPTQAGQKVTKASSRSLYVVIGDNLRVCTARGQQYPLGRPFSFTYECFRYNCDCDQNGSWECSADKTEYICDDSSGQEHSKEGHEHSRERTTQGAYRKSVVYSVGTVIRSCIVNRRQYRLGTPFSFEEGCFRHRCQCYSNGSWECPGDQSVYICPTQAGQQVKKASSRIVYVVVGDNLSACTARGKQYPLGRPFSFTYECFRYNCDCDQSGSWECSADKTKYICDDSSGQEHSKEGQEHSKEGQEHSRERTTQEAYSRSVVYSLGTVIQSCIVSGKQYRLGTPFSFEEGCFRYRCQCYSNGSWECSGDQSEYICPTQAGKKVTKASSRSVYVVIGNNLRACTARGKQYPLGRPFSFTYECFRYNCDCDQSGSWECSADKTKYICDDSSGQEHSKEGQEHSKEGQEHSRERTTQEVFQRSIIVRVGTRIVSCTAHGNEYALNRPFSFEDGCFRYRCQCFSNGSWECPGDQSEYICSQQPGQQIRKTSSRSGYIVVSNSVSACVARGQEYPLGRPFSFELDCFKYNCDCNSDGSWECLAEQAEYICDQPGGHRPKQPTTEKEGTQRSVIVRVGTRIESCTAQGKEYALNRPFSFEDSCFRYNCQCFNNGSWECPADRSEYICSQQPGQHTTTKTSSRSKYIVVSNSVRACVARGQEYPLGRPFSFELDCFKYNCDCNTDGSWECLAERADYICDQPGGHRPKQPTTEKEAFQRSVIVRVGTRIESCTAHGNEYVLNRPFSFEDGCFRYRCQCFNNGSWECPADQSQYICSQQPGQQTKKTSSRSRYIVVSNSMRACVARGQEYPLGRPFSFDLDCFKYNCDCNTDGSWECLAERAEYICDQPGGHRPKKPTIGKEAFQRTVIVRVGTRIESCIAQGKEYALNRPFSFDDGCFRYRCQCFSNGSWECPANQSRYICSQQPGQQTRKTSSRSKYIVVSNSVRACVARGQEYPLGRPFSFDLDCFKYNCDCNTDGSWECLAERAEYICDQPEGHRPKKPIIKKEGTQRSVIVRVGTRIESCTVQGGEHALNKPFSFDDGCFRYNCQCFSNGSWECPADRSEYICSQQPGQHTTKKTSSRSKYIVVSNSVRACVARGKEYPLGRPFSFELDCFKYNCDCNTDGSWECLAERAEYICHQPGGQRPKQPTTEKEGTQRSVIVRVGTRIESCTAQGKEYALNRPFTFDDGCFRYNCQCFNNGSWECPADRSEYICSQQPGQHTTKKTSSRSKYIVVSNSVRACVARGKEYPLGRPFSFELDCFKYNCDCNTDGSWECLAERAEYICDQPGGQRPKLPTTEKEGTQRSVIVRVGTRIESCTAQGKEYALNRPFTFDDGCFRYNCQCFNNGSWECPADRSEYICSQQPGQHTTKKTSSRSKYIMVSNSVRACVARGKEYPLGRPFSFELDCFKYNCDCNTDGSWECLAERAEYICHQPGGQRPKQPTTEKEGTQRSVIVRVGTRIESCTAQGKEYALNRPFTFDDGCFRYNCQCFNNGSWECPADRSEYICSQQPGQHTTKKTSSRSKYIVVSNSVRACVARGQEYPLGHPFSFDLDCFKYNCECNTDGSWECLAERAEYICDQPGGQHPKQPTTEKEAFQRSVIVRVGTMINSCTAQGKEYALNRPFSFDDGCFRYNCQCFNNGSWECPADRSEYICSQQPGQHTTTKTSSRSRYIVVSNSVRACVARGQEYPLGHPFSFDLDCFKYNCDCNTDGSWECLAERAEYICDQPDRRQPTTEKEAFQRSVIVRVGTRIESCSVKGEEYPLGEPFSIEDGCFRYVCRCFNNGSWECPGEHAEYTCPQQPGQQIKRGSSLSRYIVVSNNVRACVARGQEYPLGHPFSFEFDCFKYNCDCNTDGSWECLAERAEYICGQPGGHRPRQPITEKEAFQRSVIVRVGTRIESCSVKGEEYPLGEPFSIEDGCFRYVCRCFNNGSWECPGERAEYTCPQQPGQQIKRGSSLSRYIVVSNNVRACVARGQEYPLGHPFSFEFDCFKYNCDCNTDGSWECLAERAEYICGQPGGHRPRQPITEKEAFQRSVIVRVGTRIESCSVKGEEYPLGEPFSIEDGCFRYVCRCFNNGSWECPGEHAEYTCPQQPGQQIKRGSSLSRYIVVSNNVRACVARGQEYPLGHPFSFEFDCFKYNCDCNTDGSWECLAERAEYICGQPGGHRPRQPITEKEAFQRSVIVRVGTRIESCSVKGEEYPLGEPFSIEDGCFRYVCRCFNNGSWECPGEHAEYTCPQQPGQQIKRGSSLSRYIVVSNNVRACVARGQEYPLGHPFSFEFDCFKYNCDCNTDGSWECLAERAEYICGQPGGHRPRQPITEKEAFQRSVIVRVGTSIESCSVKSKEYPLGEPFSFEDGCFRYVCRCFNNGSWECPGERSEYICSQQPGQQIRRSSSLSRYIVVSNSVRACVARGQEYPLGRPFSFEFDCFKYNCDCNTDGSWECLAERAEYICDQHGQHHTRQTTGNKEAFQKSVIVRVGTRVKSCTAHGKEYALNRPFTFEEDCFRYRCQCFNNGSWECPADHSEYICPLVPGRETKSYNRGVYVVIGNDIRMCLAKGQQYPLGRPFSFTEGCYKYNCDCNSDGSWECPALRAEDICSQPNVQVCRDCTTIKGKTYPSQRRFVYVDGCMEYHCDCNCDGSYECPQEETVSLCKDCSDCTVDGIKHVGDSRFKHYENCESIDCTCYCNGTHECFPQSWTKVPCDDGVPIGGFTYGTKPTPPTPITLSATIKTFIFTDEFLPPVIADKRATQIPPSLGTSSPPDRGALFEQRKVSTVTNTSQIHFEDLGAKAAWRFNQSIVIQGAPLIHSSGGSSLKHGNVSLHRITSTNVRVVDRTTNETSSYSREIQRQVDHGQQENCQGCTVYTKTHRGNTTFRYIEGCYEYLCNCYCGGSWTCPDDLSVNTCERKQKKCSPCVIEGRSYRPRSTFTKQISTCKEQTCTCKCDGSHACLAESVVNVCDKTPTCRTCNVRGKIHQPNVRFPLRDGCYKYKCKCNCDGSWDCPGESGVNVCRKKPQCIQCNAKGTIAHPNSDFILNLGCIRYQCKCNCDGSWNCPGELAKNLCQTEPQCIQCNAEGTIAETNSDFTLIQGCIKYQCRCNCDGSWNCPGDKAVDTCNTDPETGCQYCDVQGERKKGHSRFELKDGCFRYQCLCKCDGGWNCPAETAVNECKPKCQKCNARGTEYEPNTTFTLQEDCFKYQCTCNCDGGWKCPKETAVDTCNTDPETGCRYCDVKGEKKKGHSRFELQEGCFKYQCVCKCDGGWNCPAETAVNTCRNQEVTGCRNCVVSDKTYPGNSRFTHEKDCFRYQCICNCDGGWNCPAESATYICDHAGQPTISCQQCTVKGHNYQGNTDFQHEEDCYQYNCHCNCDGSWNCPAESATYTCGHAGQPTTSCQQCTVKGQNYEGSTEFQFEADCYQYNCHCNCDGSWNCPAENATYTCGHAGQTTTSCQQCTVKGQKYQGNTDFQHEEACYQYNCHCNCDGSWTCPAESATYTCGHAGQPTTSCQQCTVKGQNYEGNTDFQQEEDCFQYNCHCNCDGSWNCPAENATYTCGHAGQPTTSCQQCTVKVQNYEGNTDFQHEEDCYQYNCHCNCDGSWNCPAENATYTCGHAGQTTTSCQQCTVKGQKYQGNTDFQQEEACYQYNCHCNCDGSWNCPAENATYTCGHAGQTTTSCQQCTVKGQKYQGNTDFQHEEACYQYNCHCNCDGSWNCPAESVTYTCGHAGQTTTSCQQCTVKGKKYQGNTDFQHEEACYQYNCHCNCDGSWTCPAESATYTCGHAGQPTTSCQQCTVKGQNYDGNTDFQQEEDCFQYNCHCNCDGSWNCPAENNTYTCGHAGQPTTSCQQCTVKGQNYEGNTDFQQEEDCFQYNCHCNCDGSWNCPAENATYTCGHAGQPTTSCQQCTVKGQNYEGNTDFQHEEDCYQYNCHCNCDSSWNCPAENATYSCGHAGQPTTSCQQCTVKGQKYQGNTDFQQEEDCFQYNCHCNCDGSWNCPAENATYTCGHAGLPTTSCQQCTVKGQNYEGNTDFQHEEACYQYNCHCNCDGSWNCPAESATYTCGHAGQPTTSCQQCTVKGQKYQGNTDFQHEEACYQYNCHCNCDGSWNCPAESATYTCDHAGQPTTTCQQCTAKGQKYQGNTDFQYEEACYQYNCHCNCNGSWNCPADKAVNICHRASQHCLKCTIDGKEYLGNMTFSSITNCKKYQCKCNCDASWSCDPNTSVDICNQHEVQCSQCVIDGVPYDGNSTFQRDESCYRYQCFCNCDGFWNCPPETAVDSCNRVNDTLADTSCSSCTIDNEVYKGKTKFLLDSKCYRSLCECHCNGTYTCPRENRFDKCEPSPQDKTCEKCIVDGMKYSPGISFHLEENCEKLLCTCLCDGSYTCFQKTPVPSCNITEPEECKDCVMQGKSYKGNSEFSYQNKCLKYYCSCGCDGNANCPYDKTVDTCAGYIIATEAPNCRVCRVNNTTIQGDTKFSYKRDCMLYQCTCSCNGRWKCPVETAVDTCHSQPVVTLAPTNNTQCQSCKIKLQIYKGNTVFFVNNACYRYRCKCNCDGSWECPTDTAVDICRGLQGRSIVSDSQCVNCKVRGQLYKGGEDFTLLEACFKFKCSCDCNGEWSCPSQQPENVCTYGEPTSESCRECEVKGQKYKGNQWFTYKQGCRRFQCKCRCNGNWHCPKHLTANICSVAKDKVNIDGSCKNCIVQGRKYAGDTYFSFDRNCLRFRCSCNCDGTWNCLAGPAVNICSMRHLIGACKKCYIGEKIIEGNSVFEYNFGCTKYQCNCFCDGKFFCPGDRTEDICGSETVTATSVKGMTPPSVCEKCEFDGKIFQGNSNFRYTLNCFQYECNCGCDGTWSCPPERSINICANREQPDCNQCIINGHHYNGNSQFNRQESCYEYTCTCYCNGSWVCPAEKAQYICGIQCKECLVDGFVYQGGHVKVFQEGCKRKECLCSCNGSWSCQTISKACRLSSLLVPGKDCSSCSLHGKTFPGNSWFSHIEGCFEYHCNCNCDGSWNCPHNNTKNLCNNETTTHIPQPVGAAITKTQDAHFVGCNVNGSMYYTEKFNVLKECVLYQCTCKNGKYNCPARLSTKVC